MSYYSSSAIIIIVLLVINLTFVWTSLSSIKNKSFSLKNGTSIGLRQRISAQTHKVRNLTTSIRDRFEHSHEEEEEEEAEDAKSSMKEQRTSVVVLTSLSGIYVWWPVLFGGDDSFHLLLNQEDVPRFHDVVGDDQGHIYLTAPHERTVYRLEYSNGWWISTFSNHSVMNSIRSEMPLFVEIHYVSSILYVYGHSDIQMIDLLQRPRARGSAPFIKRLRELSPSLRISDLIIDQVTSDGYVIGDSYGWCTVIRCSLGVNECVFLFKIPSSYDNRPYPCTATINFKRKIMYLSLEEKILAVHLNEQTNFDRRHILTEKRGPRSTLGYDDIVTYENSILYTDVLRPLLHICTLASTNICLNVSLVFPPPQKSILPLRLSIVQVSNLRPPDFDDQDDIELHINQSTMISPPSALLVSNKTSEFQPLRDDTSNKSYVHREANASNIWMLILGVSIGLLLAGLSFMIYYITWNKNRPKIKRDLPAATTATTKLIDPNRSSSSTKRSTSVESPFLEDGQPKFQALTSLVSNASNRYSNDSNTESSSERTTITTSSSSYQPDLIL